MKYRSINEVAEEIYITMNNNETFYHSAVESFAGEKGRENLATAAVLDYLTDYLNIDSDTAVILYYRFLPAELIEKVAELFQESWEED